MKNTILALALLLSITLIAQENPREVKQETEVKTITVNDGEKISEKKVKVVTREESDVELDENDLKKVNQNRVESNIKVEKTVLVDNDDDDTYDTITKETYYIIGEEKYLFTPKKRGFEIAFNNDKDKFIKTGKAWNSSANDYYIVNGNMHSGIGYFDANGNFVVEYYNKDTDQVEVKRYLKK